MFGFLSGCGVASFSVGIPQVSYWYPQSRQGTVLGAYGGIGNLAPGIFTLLLPYAIAVWGLAGSYLAWLLFLTIGAAIYLFFAQDAYFFQLRHQGLDFEQSRKIAREKGQELFPTGTVWQAVITAAEDTRTWGLVTLYFVSFGGFLALTAWFPTYWINLHDLDPRAAGVDRRAGLFHPRGADPSLRRHVVREDRRRADRDHGLHPRAGWARWCSPSWKISTRISQASC